ncbi:hypothetical protein Pyn_09791 [Prunus yedoensis var. nudiflora]|uniref:Uncharacterized protein n=1 Tax=Prunus yedoensis var. nudiflora TaxID=2094558 RepID=A0A314Y3J7_PRUYE|nr:hypothetical protein Pyn_09791 [Prunus yedoensis var. nudiflora]
MEIVPPFGDMRYESFLDKSKQDIASSSGLVLGRTLDLLSPLLVMLMVRFLYAKENLQGIQKHHRAMMCHAQFCFGEDGRVPM